MKPLLKMVEFFLEIDFNWLLKGKGKMLVKEAEEEKPELKTK